MDVMGKADIPMEHLEHIYSSVPRWRRILLGIMRVDTQLGLLRGRTDFQELEECLEAAAPTAS
jgi:hypothetical protein